MGRHQLDRCRENTDMEELEEEEELSGVYDYEDYRYDYSDEEYSEENYDNEEEEEEGEGGLLVEANAIPGVFNTWNPLREEYKFSGGRNTPVAVENNMKFGDTKNKDWEGKLNVGTESSERVEANGDATFPEKEEKSEDFSQQVTSEKVLVKKSSEYNILEESKSEEEKIETGDNWEKTKEDWEKRRALNEWFAGAMPLPKDDNWEEDGFLDLGGEKSEKWGQELFVRSAQSRFEPFCLLILITSLIFNSCNN